MPDDYQYDVFLSHNSVDKPEVELLANQLVQRGVRPFLDKWDLVPGKAWQSELELALAKSETAAIFYGPHGEGPWHDAEVKVVLDRMVTKRDDFRAIPVLLPGGSQEAISAFGRQLTWVDFRSGLDQLEALDRLVAGIKGEAPADHNGFGLPDEPNPYRGLERFEAEQAEFFHGRNADILTMCQALRDSQFLAVIGASGSGKSSLVRCGMATETARAILPGVSDWTRITVLPGQKPNQALALQIGKALGKTDSELSQFVDHLENRFADSDEGLRNELAIQFDGAPHPLLIIVDQFEEVFTQTEKPEIANRFVSNLINALALGPDRLRLAITLRADFLSRCLDHVGLRELINRHQLLLGGLSDEALREAIVFPARQVGAFFERGLVERILTDVAKDRRGSLPLLQQALSELWRARSGPWLTNSAYTESGGVARALQETADRAYGRLAPSEQSIANSFFLRLTTLGEGVADTRRRVDKDDIYLANVDHDEVDRVLAKFSQKDTRLIVADGLAVEFTHEAIILEWEHLRILLDQERDSIRIRQRLGDGAREWKKQKQKGTFLYMGGQLEEARKWAEAGGQALLNESEANFLKKSQSRETLRRVVRVGTISGIVLILAVSASTLGYFLKEAEKAKGEAQETAAGMARITKFVLSDFFDAANELGRSDLLDETVKIVEGHALDESSPLRRDLRTMLLITRRASEVSVSQGRLNQAVSLLLSGLDAVPSEQARDPDLLLEIAQSQISLADLYSRTRNISAGMDYAGRAGSTLDQILDQDHLGVERGRLAVFVSDLEYNKLNVDSAAQYLMEAEQWLYSSELVGTAEGADLESKILSRRARLALLVDHFKSAEELLLMNIQHLEASKTAYPDAYVGWTIEQGVAYERLARLYIAQEKYEEALKWAIQFKNQFRDLVKNDAFNFKWKYYLALAEMLNGRIHCLSGHLEESRRVLKLAELRFDEVIRIAPENTDWAAASATLISYQGDLSLEEGQIAVAVNLHKKALADRLKLLRSESSDDWLELDLGRAVLASLRSLGMIYNDLGQYEATRQLFAESKFWQAASNDESIGNYLGVVFLDAMIEQLHGLCYLSVPTSSVGEQFERALNCSKFLYRKTPSAGIAISFVKLNNLADATGYLPELLERSGFRNSISEMKAEIPKELSDLIPVN